MPRLAAQGLRPCVARKAIEWPAMKFLIVEDEIKTASSLKRGFDEAGFVVSVARDGLDAKLQLESASFDLVVLDILLPEMDGWEVLLWLCEARLQMPVLLLTGCGGSNWELMITW